MSKEAPKTKKCNYCNKRKKIEDMYHLGKLEIDSKDYWICDNCNLKHDIV